jgi:hypothetical protein
MTESNGLAFEYGHGRLHRLGWQYGPRISQPFPTLDEASLVTVVREFQPRISHLVLVRLDCPQENLTEQERAWFEISTMVLQAQLGIPVRHISDIRALVKGLAAPDEVHGNIEYPYGAVILNDGDGDERGGFVRKYLVTSPDHWQPLPFDGQSRDDRVVHVGGPELLLSLSMPDVRGVISKFVQDHSDIKRLVVWSPEELPIQHGSYNELRPDSSVACRVTILNDNTFVLESALQYG